jgi:hypothetical protein
MRWLKNIIKELRWLRDSQRFKKNKLKGGRGGDFHHD